jgi:hypothetical protein
VPKLLVNHFEWRIFLMPNYHYMPVHPQTDFFGGYFGPYIFPAVYFNPYFHHPYHHIHHHPNHTFYRDGERLSGQATWTEGGATTKCGIPWSENNYMTAAVGPTSPYKCGQTLKVINVNSVVQKEVNVTVVDTVEDFPRNKINLHRRAFQALGAPIEAGVINVEITPVTQQQYAKWGRTLLEVTKNSYPNYDIVDYNFVGSKDVNDNLVQETFKFTLQRGQEKKVINAHVTFNPATENIISINLDED